MLLHRKPATPDRDEVTEHYAEVAFLATAEAYGLTDPRTINAYTAWSERQVPARKAAS